MKKILISAIFIFLSVNSHSYHRDYYYGSQRISGEVIYNGPTLACRLWNDGYRSVRILSIDYDLWYSNYFGFDTSYRHTVYCDYNCYLNSGSVNIYNGPQNDGAFSARCSARVGNNNGW